LNRRDPGGRDKWRRCGQPEANEQRQSLHADTDIPFEAR
jgi:hypothetical protein